MNHITTVFYCIHLCGGVNQNVLLSGCNLVYLTLLVPALVKCRLYMFIILLQLLKNTHLLVIKKSYMLLIFSDVVASIFLLN